MGEVVKCSTAAALQVGWGKNPAALKVELLELESSFLCSEFWLLLVPASLV